MKVTINLNETKPKMQYPCLMRNLLKFYPQVVILVTGRLYDDRCVGTVIVGNKFNLLGEHRDDWVMQNLEPLEDCATIELSNE